jgi:site-specific DNA-methyltransferase (adenine-specific)
VTLPAPYYRDDDNGIVLYCGDCLDILPELEPGSVDAVVTDPPFFVPAIHYQSRKQWQRQWGDMTVLQHWWGLMCDTFRPVLKESGHALTFCNADSYPAFYVPMFGRWQKLVCLVWDKCRPGLGHIWRHQHELVIAARNANSWEPNDGKLRPDVLRYTATLSEDRDHPVEKPEEMLADIVESVAPCGSIVGDWFVGSGTTGVACLRTGRRFVGIEIAERYCEIAANRLRKERDRTVLFGQAERKRQREFLEPEL